MELSILPRESTMIGLHEWYFIVDNLRRTRKLFKLVVPETDVHCSIGNEKCQAWVTRPRVSFIVFPLLCKRIRSVIEKKGIYSFNIARCILNLPRERERENNFLVLVRRLFSFPSRLCLNTMSYEHRLRILFRIKITNFFLTVQISIKKFYIKFKRSRKRRKILFCVRIVNHSEHRNSNK